MGPRPLGPAHAAARRKGPQRDDVAEPSGQRSPSGKPWLQVGALPRLHMHVVGTAGIWAACSLLCRPRTAAAALFCNTDVELQLRQGGGAQSAHRHLFWSALTGSERRRMRPVRGSRVLEEQPENRALAIAHTPQSDHAFHEEHEGTDMRLGDAYQARLPRYTGGPPRVLGELATTGCHRPGSGGQRNLSEPGCGATSPVAPTSSSCRQQVANGARVREQVQPRVHARRPQLSLARPACRCMPVLLLCRALAARWHLYPLHLSRPRLSLSCVHHVCVQARQARRGSRWRRCRGCQRQRPSPLPPGRSGSRPRRSRGMPPPTSGCARVRRHAGGTCLPPSFSLLTACGLHRCAVCRARRRHPPGRRAARTAA